MGRKLKFLKTRLFLEEIIYSAKKVVQRKNANISQKIFHDIVDMHIFLKLILFPIFSWVKRLKILSGGEMASHIVT